MLGHILARALKGKRDELFLSTKSGHLMWKGPYGDGGSRKHLIAGLDQSLRRMKLDYVDVFYSHRPDPSTPLEETIGALVHAVRSGRALYAGLSKYPPELFKQACAMLREEKTPCLLHQFRYHLLDRSCEKGMLPASREAETGTIVFSPLAQGLLTGKYLDGSLPEDSRAARQDSVFLTPRQVQETASRVRSLHQLASEAGLPLTQLALRWLLQQKGITSVLVGVRNRRQLEECAQASGQEPLGQDLLAAVDALTSPAS